MKYKMLHSFYAPLDKEPELVSIEEDIYDLESLPNVTSRMVTEWRYDGTKIIRQLNGAYKAIIVLLAQKV